MARNPNVNTTKISFQYIGLGEQQGGGILANSIIIPSIFKIGYSDTSVRLTIKPDPYKNSSLKGFITYKFYKILTSAN